MHQTSLEIQQAFPADKKRLSQSTEDHLRLKMNSMSKYGCQGYEQQFQVHTYSNIINYFSSSSSYL